MDARPWILHVDLDQFLAAVEVLRHPELRGRPIVVGGAGDPTQRRVVVSTASYEARAFGIHSGMPLRAAARRCPDAVFLPLDSPTYEAASAHVMETLRGFPVVVEVLGWDEAFLGAVTVEPERLASDIQLGVQAGTGLDCSIGIGQNRLQAKLATGFGKPAGIARLTDETWIAVMGDRPTTAVWGIGSGTGRKLAGLGFDTVADLAAADLALLAATFGPVIGPGLKAMGLGMGSTEVRAEPWVPRSQSHETTFPEDLVDRPVIEAQVSRLVRELAAEVADGGRLVVRVGVKVRVAPFFTSSSAMQLPEPTLDPGAIEHAAVAVLARFDLSRPVRLLGVRVEFERPADAGQAGGSGATSAGP